MKQENDLYLARKTIKNLQSALGTLMVSGDESEVDDPMDENESVVAEIDQNDSFFAHQYTFKTNVRKLFSH